MNKTVISGYSSISPFGENFQKLYINGNSGHAQLNNVCDKHFGDAATGMIKDDLFRKYIEDRERLKFDRISMMVTHVIKNLIDHSEISHDAEALENTGIISGSGFGSVMSSATMLHELYDKGHERVDPMKFPHTSNNYPISIGAIKYKIKGPITAIIAGNGAGFTALSFARNLIETGSAPRIIVIGVDEICDHLYRYLLESQYICESQKTENSYPNGNAIVCEGCVGILLESQESARARNAKIYGEIISETVTYGGKRVDESKILNNVNKTIRLHSLPNTESVLYVKNQTGNVQEKLIEDKALGELRQLGYAFQNQIALKPFIGNYLGASGLMELAFILQEFKGGMTGINREHELVVPGLDSCMITNYGLGGNLCSLLFSCN